MIKIFYRLTTGHLCKCLHPDIVFKGIYPAGLFQHALIKVFLKLCSMKLLLRAISFKLNFISKSVDFEAEFELLAILVLGLGLEVLLVVTFSQEFIVLGGSKLLVIFKLWLLGRLSNGLILTTRLKTCHEFILLRRLQTLKYIFNIFHRRVITFPFTRA